MIESTIQRYEILARLGEGGAGIVYKAHDPVLKRDVAVKILRPELSGPTATKERFLQEARIVSSIDHPNICTIYDVGESTDGQLYMVMPCYNGESLRAKLRKGALSPDEIRTIALQVGEGLSAAHERRVIHSDIKPENILFTDDGIAKILDFGVAHLTASAPMEDKRSSGGTVAYMSPEQARGDAADERSDIWSFGVVLYEMMTGSPPFGRDYELSVLYRIANTEPEPIPRDLPGSTDALIETCMRCLRKSAVERPASMKEVLDALQRPPTARRSQKKGTTAIRVAVIAGTIIAVAIGGYFTVHHLTGAGAGASGRIRIAVLRFDDRAAAGRGADRGGELQGALTTELTGVERLGVYDPVNLNGKLRTVVDQKQADMHAVFDVLRENAILYVIGGRIMPSGAGAILQVTVTDVQSGEVVFGTDVPYRDSTDLSTPISSIARQILTYFDLHVLGGEKQELKTWQKFRTRNIEAQRLMMTATEMQYRGEPGIKQYLTGALQLDSTYVAPRVWLVIADLGRGERAEAEAQYAVLRRLEPNASPFERAMIRCSAGWLDGDLGAVERNLQDALSYSPGNPVLSYELARVRMAMSNFRGMITALHGVVDSSWKYSHAHALLGFAYVALGIIDSGRIFLENATAMLPYHPVVFVQLIHLDLAAGKTALAAEHERRYLSMIELAHGNRDSAKADLAGFCLSNGHVEWGLRLASELATKNPKSAEYQSLFGQALTAANRIPEARQRLVQAIALNRRYAPPYAILGQIEEAAGARMKAAQYYEKSLLYDSTGIYSELARLGLKRVKP